MNSFLLVWNPKRWEWKDLEERITEIKTKGFTTRDWSCGNTTKIQEGDRVYVIRLGINPKGIFATGVVERARHREKHRDPAESKNIWFVTVKFDKIFNPEKEAIIDRTKLNRPEFQPMHWDSQMSGVQITDTVAKNLEKEWKLLVDKK